MQAQRTEPFATQSDRRADRGERRITLSGGAVLISRRVNGVSMFIRVPVSAYRGVALDVRQNQQGGADYCLSLTHRDPDLDILLTRTQDGGAVAADWKYWSATLNLPRLSQDEQNEAEEAGFFAGRAARSAVTARRSRFARRRKPGEARRAKQVFVGEREIIAYE